MTKPAARFNRISQLIVYLKSTEVEKKGKYKKKGQHIDERRMLKAKR